MSTAQVAYSGREIAPVRQVKGLNNKSKKAKVVSISLGLQKKNPSIEKNSALETEQLIIEHRVKARKLSRSMLRRWRSRLDIEELDSIVDLALCEAASRYNAKKGASFMTFFFYHLHGYLVRAVQENCNQNTVPASSYEIAELSSDYTTTTIKNGVYKSASASDVVDALSNHEYLLPDELLYKKEIAKISIGACDGLTELQREIVYRLFILEESIVDISRDLGYSRCHISRVKRKAFEFLFSELSGKIEGAPKTPAFLDEDEDLSLRRPTRRRRTRKKVESKFKHLSKVAV